MGKFKASYVGNAKGDVRAFGTTFEEGKAAEVDDRYASKVENNPYFETGAVKAKKTDTNRSTDDGLKAEHHGGGKFNITHGEEVVAEGLSKADADSFNAMSAEDKAEYVKAKK
jgi:hypothetical protein